MNKQNYYNINNIINNATQYNIVMCERNSGKRHAKQEYKKYLRNKHLYNLSTEV